MLDLTPRQHEIFDYIRKRIAGGVPPTYREIGDAFGIRSPNGMQCHIRRLIAKEYITIEPNRARTIRLTRREKGMPLLTLDDIAAGIYPR